MNGIRQRVLQWTTCEPQKSMLFLFSLMLVRLAVQLHLYRDGFISLSADEANRGIKAAQWALNPQFNFIRDIQDIWLPFEKYLNGFALMVWPEVIKAPRVTVFLASCVTLIAWFALIYYLFRKFSVAAFATMLTASIPWFTWLSGTPMLEMYYFAGFFAGLFFLLVWLQDNRSGFWALAGLSFLISSGFHYQSWTFINLVNLLTLVYLVRFFTQRNYRRLLRLVGYYFISNSLIIAITAFSYAQTGELFTFLSHHTEYSKWIYSGYNIPIFEKLLYYPKLAFQNSSVFFWLLSFVSIVFLVKHKNTALKWFPLAVGLLVLGFNSIMNLFSVPATAAPGRYSVFYLIVLTPYIADGLYQIWRLGKGSGHRGLACVSSGVVAFLCLFSLWWGVSRFHSYQNGISIEALGAGANLNRLMEQAGPEDRPAYMVELSYWDFLTVQLTAGHYDSIHFDREYDLFNRHTPSIFALDAEQVQDILVDQDIRFVAIKDPAIKALIGQMEFLSEIDNVGSWMIYRFQ